MKYPTDRFVLQCRGVEVDCRPFQRRGAQVMGVLNVTPDSFSDGGLYLDPDDAIDRTEEMVREGAKIIDVGGESSRPAGSVYGEGADQLSADDEQARILPVIRGIVAKFPDVAISVDTYKPDVAQAALEAGAHIINDITGLHQQNGLAEVVAAYDAPLIVMHSIGTPGSFPHQHEYDDVVGDVRAALASSVGCAEKAGIEQIIIDPGFGFGKTPHDNLRLLAAVPELLELGRPVMVGISRKSTIGSILETPDSPRPIGERLYGTLGATAVAVSRGASIVRTHDVRATFDMLVGVGATINSKSEDTDIL